MRSLRRRDRGRQLSPRADLFWRFAFPGVVVAAGVAVLLLALEAGRTVLTQTVGSVEQELELAPDEPGYVELVAATPTLLVLNTHDGGLTGVAFLARTGIDAGGGVVLLPADLVVAADPASTGGGEMLSAVFARAGPDAVARSAEALFGLGFDEVAEVPTERLARAIAPASPLPYLLADDLVESALDSSQRVLYGAGRYDLSALDAAAVYSHRNADEADGNRVQRQRAIWESWLGVIARSQDPEAVIGPADSPLAPFLRAFAAGTTVVDVVPFESVTAEPGAAVVPRLGAESRSWLTAKAQELVPWPQQPQSFLRPRVQLLDGAGDPSVRDALAADVVAAGGVVTVIGNAGEFGVGATQFAYHRAELVNDPITNSIAVALGVDMTLIELGEGASDVVDITVTVGLDRAAR